MSLLQAHTDILCFSHNNTLLMTRQRMLERQGYVVLGVLSQAEFRAGICRSAVNLVLLCQTLSDEEWRDALHFISEHAPTARCAVFRTSRERAFPQGDVAIVNTGDGPAAFLQTVNRMLLPTAAVHWAN